MTERCPVPHDDHPQSDRTPIYVNTRAALRRLCAGEDPNDVFQHSRGNVTLGELKNSAEAIAGKKKDRVNTLLAAGAVDTASRLATLPYARPNDIYRLDLSSLPLHSQQSTTCDDINGIYFPIFDFIVYEELGEVIDDWRVTPQSTDITEDISQKLTKKSIFSFHKTAKEIINDRLKGNVDTVTERIPDFYAKILSIYEQQIGVVDPCLAESYPSPSLEIFQGIVQESVGILLSQAARNDHYRIISEKSTALFSPSSDSVNEDVCLKLNKRPNGRFRVSLTPQTRKAIEAQFDKETVPDQIITGCPAMPLIQAMLQRVDSYIETFKAS